MKVLHKLSLLALLGCFAVAAPACSSSTGSDSDGENDDDSKVTPAEKGTVSKTITAADGGTIEAPGGSAALTIAAGALSEDVEITLTVDDPEGTSIASTYDFGPDGTTFSTPATLEIEVGTYQPPEGKKAVLAILEDDTWTEVPGSSLANGKVSGPVSHFSKFSLIIVAGDVVLVSECGDTAANFSACGLAGGSEVGTWKISDICAATQPFGDAGGFGEDCPDATADLDFTLDGTITLDGTTSEQSGWTSTITSTLHIPNTCLQNGQTCTEIGEDFAEDGGTCTDTGTECQCIATQTDPASEAKSEAYTISGNTIVFGDGEPADFCLKDNDTMEVLTSKGEVDDEGHSKEAVLVLTRQ